jgi:hypothetical protein
MTIGVFITNYKAWSVTQETVQAVIDLHPNPEEIQQILVLDDASDAPATWRGNNGLVQIHQNSQNLGYVKSVNAGMRHMQTDLVVVLDCDAKPLSAFAEIVRTSFAEQSDLGAIGFMQTDESKKLRPSGELTPTLLEFIIGPSLFYRIPERIRNLFLPVGRSMCIHSCCMAIRKKAFDNVGGFDESFDFLDGDMDFSWSLLEKSWKNSICDKILCYHPGGGSPQTTHRRVLRQHRNRWKLLYKHGGIRFPLVCKLMLGVRHLLETMMLIILYFITYQKKIKTKLQTRVSLLKSFWRNYETVI